SPKLVRELFFIQAEDGIRDFHVTGVQTCALPISKPGDFAAVHICPEDSADIPDTDEARLVILHPRYTHASKSNESEAVDFARARSEERRAGKGVSNPGPLDQ